MWGCKLCKKYFMSRTAVRYHKKMFHSAEKPSVQCKICQKIVGHDITLKRHHKIHDEDALVYDCNLCNKVFTRNDNLTRHRKTVHNTVHLEVDLVELLKNGENVYECKVCKVTFSGPDGDKDLVSHLVNECKP